MQKLLRTLGLLESDERQAALRAVLTVYPLEPLSGALRTSRWRLTRDACDASVTESVTPASPEPRRQRHGKRDASVTADAMVPPKTPSGFALKDLNFPGFTSFWSHFPKRVGKGKAFEAWKKNGCEQHNGIVLESLQNQLTYLIREGGKFTPNPATWLNEHRWEDEPPQVPEVFTAERLWEEGKRERATER